MFKLGYIGGLGMMAGPAATHLTPASVAQVLRVHDRGSPGQLRDQFRQAWQQHGAELVGTLDELVGPGDLDGVVICAGKNGDDLPLIVETARQLTEASDNRPFILHLSTLSPAFAEHAAQFCADNGIDYVNYPLTGGPLGAQLGGADPKGMLILASGDEALYNRLLPLLQVLGNPKYFGTSVTAGAITKLVGHHMVFNGLTGISSAAAIHADCFNQGQLGGDAQADYLGFLNGGAGGTRQWDVALSKGIKDDCWDQGFSIVHAVVDTLYAARLAVDAGLPRLSIQGMTNMAFAFSFILQQNPASSLATHSVVQQLVRANSGALDAFMAVNGAFGADASQVIDDCVATLPSAIQQAALMDISPQHFSL